MPVMSFVVGHFSSVADSCIAHCLLWVWSYDL